MVELARAALVERAEALQWAAARLPLASDLEAVHDTRVALRRLREAERGFEGCLHQPAGRRRRRLRALERALGPLRDAQVRLELLGEVLGPVAVSRDRSDDPRASVGFGREVVAGRGAELRPGLRGLEAEARRCLADAAAEEMAWRHREMVGGPNLARLRRMARVPSVVEPVPGVTPGRELAVVQLPRFFRQASRGQGDSAGLHLRRVRTRRLRYRLELFAPALAPEHQVVLQELRRLQRLLGQCHDLSVLVAWIDRAAKQQQRELRPALRRLVVRVELEHESAQEAAELELARLDASAWWRTAERACLG